MRSLLFIRYGLRMPLLLLCSAPLLAQAPNATRSEPGTTQPVSANSANNTAVTPQGVTASLDIPTIAAQALAASPTARAAQQRLVETQAKLAEAGALRRLQPTLTTSGSGSYGQVAQPASTQTFGTLQSTLTIPLPNGRRVSAQQAQAQAQLRAAQAGLERARLDLTFRASDAYYNVLRTRSARDIAQDNLDQAQRQVDDAQKRVDAGDLPVADVLKAQVPVAQAKVTLARAQNTVRVAEQTLNSLLVRDLATPLTLTPRPDLPPLTLTRSQAVAQALARSPDVREAQANLDAAEAAVKVSRRSRDPEYSTQASYLLTNDITAYSNLATLMFTVTFPLGDSGAARQQVKQAQAQLEQARSALALAKQQVQLAAEGAFLDVETDQANVTATQETVRIAQDSLVKARQAFLAGLTTTRDVLDAQLALAQARNEANAAVYDLAAARAKLDQVIGQTINP